MNRREFLLNAAAGLFVAASPKIIVDLAANTWRNKLTAADSIKAAEILKENALRPVVINGETYYAMLVNPLFCGAVAAWDHVVIHDNRNAVEIYSELIYDTPPRPISFGEASPVYPTNT